MQVDTKALIDDILYCIFKFLSATDRKNAKLVCRQWYRICTCRVFQEDEAFFFCGATFQVPWILISTILISTGRDSYNLKLKNYVIDTHSLHLWGQCGLGIKSLHIDSCLLRFDIMIYWILIYCPNMVNLIVDGVEFLNPESATRCENILWPFYPFPQSTPRVENLKLFKFKSEFLEYDLSHITSDFPSIRTLAVSIVTEKYEHRFESLLKLLSTRLNRVDALSIVFEGDEYSSFPTEPKLNLSCMRKYDLSKLKNVELIVNFYTLSDVSLATILHYKFWTSITITSHHTEPPKFSKFLFCLLTECRQLEKMKILWRITHYSQFYEVFPAFVKSQLKSLDMEIDDRRLSINQQELEYEKEIAKIKFNDLPQNNTILDLSVYNHRETDFFSSIFLNSLFPEVRHFKVIRADLRIVFETMKKLKSLRAEYNCANNWPISIFGFNIVIANLEFLSISVFNYEKLFPTTSWPNLKYLNLECSIEELVREPIWKLEPLTERFRIIFSMISQSAPNLRGFHLKLADFNLISLPLSTTVDINKEILDEFFNSCLNLKHLHYIWAFVGNSKITNSIAKRRMMTCHQQLPFLRAAFCMTNNLKLSTFFNSIHQKVEFYEQNSNFQVDPFEYWLSGR